MEYYVSNMYVFFYPLWKQWFRIQVLLFLPNLNQDGNIMSKVIPHKTNICEVLHSSQSPASIRFKKLKNKHVLDLLVGGLNPSEKYISQLGWLFPIYGKIENVPNHQPVFLVASNHHPMIHPSRFQERYQINSNYIKLSTLFWDVGKII